MTAGRDYAHKRRRGRSCGESITQGHMLRRLTQEKTEVVAEDEVAGRQKAGWS